MCHHAGSENQFRLVLRKMRMDNEIASKLGPRGGSRGGVERIYRLLNGSDAMQEESVSKPQAEDVDVLRVRAEAEVDEIELESIEGAIVIEPLVDIKRTSIEDATVSVEALERIEREREYDEYEAARDGSADTQEQPEMAVSETVMEEAAAEPIKQEAPPFRVGVYSDGTMVLERPDEDVYEIDKTEFAAMVEFARTVGWLAA